MTHSELKHKADVLEKPLFLVMHGVPLEVVDHATANQLAVMYDIVEHDIKTTANTVAMGIATAFGGNKDE